MMLTAAAVLMLAACGGSAASPAPVADPISPGLPAATQPAAAPAELVVTYPRPNALAELPLVELVAPGALNAGPAPLFEWRASEGAASYRLSVRGPEGLAWAWQGPQTSVRYGGVAEGQAGPTIVPGMLWSVAALGGDGSLVALSELRGVSPSEDPGPDWMAAPAAAGSPSPTPRPAEQPGPAGTCGLLAAAEIGSAIRGDWGTPDQTAATGIQGICSWTSANGSLLDLYVAPAEQYDPAGWGADETLDGLGEQAYRTTKGWDRRIGFVSGGLSVMLVIDYPKVDPEGFLELARLIEQRLG
jgi:hypothetical protein